MFVGYSDEHRCWTGVQAQFIEDRHLFLKLSRRWTLAE
jgi:hypothetical protein